MNEPEYDFLVDLGTVATLSATLYLTLIMIRRLVHRWERRLAVQAAASVRREMADHVPVMLERLLAHYTEEPERERSDTSSVPSSPFSPQHSFRWVEFGAQTPLVLEVEPPRSGLDPERAPSPPAGPGCQPAAWMERLHQSIDRHTRMHDIQLLTDEEDRRIVDAAVTRLRARACWVSRCLPRSVIRAAVMRARGSIHHECTRLLVQRCERFLSLSNTLRGAEAPAPGSPTLPRGGVRSFRLGPMRPASPRPSVSAL